MQVCAKSRSDETEAILSIPDARVALLTNMLPPYLVPVCSELSGRLGGLRVFLSTAMEGDRPWRPRWDGVDVAIQKSVRLRARQKYPQGFTAEIERHLPYDTLQQLVKYSPDTVVSAQLGLRTIQAILYRRLWTRSRLVIWVDASEHTERRVGRVLNAVRRILLRHADAVLAVGESGRRYLEQLGVAPDRIIEVPYVVESSPFHSCKLQREKAEMYRLLYVGQFIDRKGVLPFIRQLSAWAEVHNERRCELWLVGDGPRRADIAKAATPPNLALRLFGNVSYESLPKFYAQAGVTVLPTLADTWGLVVNESLAAGVPVLGSLYSQAAECLIQDGANGWSYRPDLEGSTQSALDRVMNTSSEELARMRIHARESVSSLTPQYAATRFLRAIIKAGSHAPRRCSAAGSADRGRR